MSLHRTYCENTRQWPKVKIKPSPKSNRFGVILPHGLRLGMEALTGVDLKRVRVHYDSDLPIRLNAAGFAQGGDIYLAQGQEHLLPHELGHVVQQALGWVKPTKAVNGVPVNDDPHLEQQATELGEQALGLAFA